MEKSLITSASLIKSSKYRFNILQALSQKIKTPSEISKNTDIKLNHISTFLSELSEEGLIECLNKEEKKGRFYQITKKGLNVLDFILKNSGGNK